jgi:hypothetical protein
MPAFTMPELPFLTKKEEVKPEVKPEEKPE